MQPDLRTWMEETRRHSELVCFEGVHWNVEMGALAARATREKPVPALLFDKVPGYSKGYRVLVNTLADPARVSRTAGLEPAETSLDAVRAWKEKYSAVTPLPYRVVESGPVLQHRLQGKEVALSRFPAPKWREEDGGRYIGTATLCVTRGPDDGKVNVSTARVMIHDENHVFYRVSAGKDSRRHFEESQARRQPLPIAISLGHLPSLLLVSGLAIPYGTCEYDVWGGLTGQPLETVETPLHGLPVPAHSEIVLEGKVLLDRFGPEGPFGEWSGYYSRSVRQEPLIEVQAVYYRSDPILLGIATSKPPSELTTFWAVVRSALLWRQLEEAGIGGIEGVWCHPAGGSRLFNVIRLRQQHPGHPRQALMAAASLPAAAYMGRYFVAVDEDVDPSDLDDVIWAISTRSDPVRHLDRIRGTWGGPLDPLAREEDGGLNSRLLIDACRPYQSAFPKVAGYSEKAAARARQLWTSRLDES